MDIQATGAVLPRRIDKREVIDERRLNAQNRGLEGSRQLNFYQSNHLPTLSFVSF